MNYKRSFIALLAILMIFTTLSCDNSHSETNRHRRHNFILLYSSLNTVIAKEIGEGHVVQGLKDAVLAKKRLYPSLQRMASTSLERKAISVWDRWFYTLGVFVQKPDDYNWNNFLQSARMLNDYLNQLIEEYEEDYDTTWNSFEFPLKQW